MKFCFSGSPLIAENQRGVWVSVSRGLHCERRGLSEQPPRRRMSDEPAQSGVGAATGEGTTEPAQMPPEGQDTGEAPAPEQVIAEEYIRLADEALL